jgi:hypothetical protein
MSFTTKAEAHYCEIRAYTTKPDRRAFGAVKTSREYRVLRLLATLVAQDDRRKKDDSVVDR